MSARPRAPGAPPGPRIDFNALKPPKGYVPGLGRGAAGFTTRSDIGPSAPAPEAGGKAASQPGKFDAFLGDDAGTFAGATLDAEDREAEAAWEAVERRMAERGRRGRKREAKAGPGGATVAAALLGSAGSDAVPVSENFADLRRGLASISEEAWEAIPDIGPASGKRQRRELFTPAPDTLLAGAASAAGIAGGVNVSRTALEIEDALGGARGPAGPLSAASGGRDLSAVGAGRQAAVRVRLDSLSDSVTGQTVADPRSYLDGLKSTVVRSDAELSDIKRARLLLRSVVTSNPAHAPGWIAAARLEEAADKPAAARALALEGCERCPSDAGVWAEAARLHPGPEGKAVLARALAALPRNVDLWLLAAEREKTPAGQRKVILRGLERLPESAALWKAAVERSGEDDARTLLARAVECCPQHVELWLALARLETYDKAKKVLTNARKAIPTSPEVLLASLELVETNETAKLARAHAEAAQRSRSRDAAAAPAAAAPAAPPSAARAPASAAPPSAARAPASASRLPASAFAPLDAMLDGMLRNGLRHLERAGGTVERSWWLEQSQALERRPGAAACPRLSAAVARRVGALGIDARDLLAALGADAAQAAAAGAPAAARALLRLAVDASPSDEGAWRALADLERRCGSPEALDAVLAEATARCPLSVDLWLAAADERRARGDAEGARAVLAKAFVRNPHAEAVWIAAAEAELEADEPERAREILRRARERGAGGGGENDPDQGAAAASTAPASASAASASASAYPGRSLRCSARVWMRSAQLERALARPDRERALLAAAVEARPRAWKLWAMRAQAEERAGGGGDLARARELYAAACKACPHAAPLWIGAARCEVLSFGLRGGAGRARAALERGRAALERGRAAVAKALRAAVAAAGGVSAARDASAIAAGAGGTLSVAPGAGGVATALPGAASSLAGLGGVGGVAAAAAAASLAGGAATNGGFASTVSGAGVALSSSASPSGSSAGPSAGAGGRGDPTGERASPEAALDLASLFLAGVRVEDAAAWRSAQREDRGGEASLGARPLGGAADTPLGSRSLGDAASPEEAERVARATGSLPAFLFPSEEGSRDGALSFSSLLPLGATPRTLEETSWAFGDACSPPRRFPPSPAGDALLARGLQALPSSGPLLAEWLRRAPRQARKGRAADALRRADADADVVSAVAELFLAERKADKARVWLERAVAAAPRLGDAWAKLVRLEREAHARTNKKGKRTGETTADRSEGAGAGTEGGTGTKTGSEEHAGASDPTLHGETALARLEACVRAAPNRGERWLAAAKRPVPLARAVAGGGPGAGSAPPLPPVESVLVPWGRARKTERVLEEVILAVAKANDFA